MMYLVSQTKDLHNIRLATLANNEPSKKKYKKLKMPTIPPPVYKYKSRTGSKPKYFAKDANAAENGSTGRRQNQNAQPGKWKRGCQTFGLCLSFLLFATLGLSVIAGLIAGVGWLIVKIGPPLDSPVLGFDDTFLIL